MNNFQLLEKIEALDVYSHKAVAQFPKSERHVLASDVREAVAGMMRLTIRALKQYHKKTTLTDLDIEVDYLRKLIRKSHRLGYIDGHKYEIWSRHVDEIGRMVGGWIGSQKAAGGGAS